ncbi:MAG: glutamate dehydrogenase [Planctomycetota bacterium]|jgi:glutamate dehydrogenase
MDKNTETPSSATVTDPQAIVDELTLSLRETAEEVVPWFIDNMPATYFLDTGPKERLTHLRTILAAKASGRPVDMVLRDDERGQWTFMGEENYPGILSEFMKALPEHLPLRSAKIHTAKDNNLIIVSFSFSETKVFKADNDERRAKLKEVYDYAVSLNPEVTEPEVQDHLERCPENYVQVLTPLRIMRKWGYFDAVSGNDKAMVALEQELDPGYSRVVVTISNCAPYRMFRRINTRLGRAGIRVDRAYLDVLDDKEYGKVNTMGFIVHGPDGQPLDPNSELWTSVCKDLQRLKWIDVNTLFLAYRHEGLSLTRAEVIMALCHLAHHMLVKTNPAAFDRDHILKGAEKNYRFTSEIVDIFLLRFNPKRPMLDEEFNKVADDLRVRIDANVDFQTEQVMLKTLLDAVAGVLRTNVFLPDRFALAMRIAPTLLATDERPELPYGVFFIHGRSFNGFHVRFRDIARGGVRCVRTIGVDQHAREVERLYDEVYGLAFAQQLKNKDIPEGGSKAVVLLEPDTPVNRCVKAFVDGLLDLIAPPTEGQEELVDYFGQPELLYLGPDENITPELIEWIAARAKRRNYPSPNAFMSSKPGAGINHKTYGVTSEGVTVFLDASLRHIGIDPNKQTFTVKITGGPDGDVAGNEIRILNRDYGENAKIVGIADGSGCGEDADGLDHQELLRLFREGLPIAEFDRAKLGPKGSVLEVNDPDGVHARNSMHNRIKSDAFIPAGGRPSTIHDTNWHEFLDENKVPASRVIIEGANLFLTREARLRLSEAGVLIIKDSSANKCGVITSSFEIAASMILDESEFLEIKTTFIEQILTKLRKLARREADLLLRMNTHQPEIPLFELSIRLSRVVIRTADAIQSAINALDETDPALMKRLVIDHLPQALVEKAQDRLWTEMPKAYLEWIMAKSLAARLVYREGFEYLESMSEKTIARLAVQYLRLETEREELAHEVQSSNLPSKDRIVSILDRAGILSTLGS